MGRRRGFFAELHHQAKMAAKERERAERAAVREHAAALRRAEQARRAEERARAQLARASEAERKRLEREAKQAHIAAMEARAEEMNSQLAEVYDEIDSLLSATLSVDDHVDLEDLRLVAQHPPFPRPDLEQPIPQPEMPADPPRPALTLSEAPTGFRKIVGGKKYRRSVSASREAHRLAVAAWEDDCRRTAATRAQLLEDHARAEARRVAERDVMRTRYSQERSVRESEAAEHNARIDKLIVDLGYGTREAIEEYVSIVLSNSVYPPHFPVSHDFDFDSGTAELRLRVTIPSPDQIPAVKHFKYGRSADEISSTALTQKACRDRYAGAVHQVALRSFHEVFEADRRGLIKTIALEVGTETVHPATGLLTYVPFVAAAADRQSFLTFDLANVVPAATLQHLGAAVSKDPFALVEVDASGIRKL